MYIVFRGIRHHLHGIDVEEEYWCFDEEGKSRRVDIVMMNRSKKSAIIIDPTVRCEKGLDQPAKVDAEKKSIYKPCIPDLRKRLQQKYPYVKDCSFEVVGLLIGAKGTIPTFVEKFRQKIGLPKSVIENVVLEALKGSCLIYFNHMKSD